MEKKTLTSGVEDTPVSTPNAPTPQAAKRPDRSTAGFHCYIGPNLAGLIQHGAIFRGSRRKALSAAAPAIEKQPLVRTLIIAGEDLPEARIKAKTPGTALYKNYRKVAGKQ